ncbi:unnamed protein product [Linum tenue]|uniref:Pentatricopeptide repeat-containing protein n=2 Tax=Linum tenue TaxID=586396 RepID=A0AAV0S2R5_9ROSI|nr:unnamed protein product [Linum tenue]
MPLKLLVKTRSVVCLSSCHLRLLSTEITTVVSPPQPPAEQEAPVIKQALEILRRPEKEWDAAQLNQILFSASPFFLFKIARRLPSSSQALKFLQFLRQSSSDPSPPPDERSLSHALQAVFELASRQPNSTQSVYEVYTASRDLGVQLTPNAAAILLRCLGRNGMMSEAEFFFNGFDSAVKNSHVRNVWIKLLLQSGRFDDALKVLDEMLQPSTTSDCKVDDFTAAQFFTFFLNWRSHGRLIPEEEMIDLVLKFARLGVFPTSVWTTQFVTMLSWKRKINSAWNLLDELMKLEAPVDAAPCNALLTGLGKEMDIKKMNAVMVKMKEAEIQPDVVTFGILINHLCKHRRLDQALEVLDKMQGEMSIEPDVVIFNTIIDGLSKVGRQEEAFELVEKMKSQHRGCSPNTVTYNCLIDGFCKAGEIDKGINLFHEMQEMELVPNAITVNTLVHGMCMYGRTSNAVRFFYEMRSKGLWGTAVSYTSLIDAFCKVNNIARAIEIFDEMVTDGFPPDSYVYYTLISGLTRAGRMNEALTYFQTLKDSGFSPDVVCYNVLISGLFNTNKADKAREIFEEMEKAGARPDGVTYNTLIAYHAKDGNFIEARKLLKKMVNEGHVPTVVTYGALIHAYCLNQKVNEAMALFKELRGSSKVTPNGVIYNILIDCLCKKQDVQQALALMDDMEVRGAKASANTFNAVFRALREERMVNKAFELMDRMVRQGINPDYMTMDILTEWLSGIGEMEKLRRFVEGCTVSEGDHAAGDGAAAAAS